jgi:hypothetical protein
LRLKGVLFKGLVYTRRKQILLGGPWLLRQLCKEWMELAVFKVKKSPMDN